MEYVWLAWNRYGYHERDFLGVYSSPEKAIDAIMKSAQGTNITLNEELGDYIEYVSRGQWWTAEREEVL